MKKLIASLIVCLGLIVSCTQPTSNTVTVVSAPVIMPGGGAVLTTDSVKLSCQTQGATIVYTTDGTDPTESSKKYISAFSLTAGSCVVKSLAFSNGTDSTISSAAFVVSAPAVTPTVTPIISPSGGSVLTSNLISISDLGTTIYYTTDGSDPNKTSTLYSVPFALSSGSVIVKAIAYQNSIASNIATSAFIVTAPSVVLPNVSTPVISPSGGSILTTNSITLSDSTDSAKIVYTSDGTDPTHSSKVYSSAIVPTVGNITIKALAYKDNMTDSATVSASFIVTSPVTPTVVLPVASTPVISPSGGSISTTNTITLSDSTDASKIVYTLDGTDPTHSSKIYTTPITPTAGSLTVKALAYKDSMSDSAIVSASFIVSSPPVNAPPIVSTPIIVPSGGKIFTTDTVSMTCSTLGASIAYTIDGSDPLVTSLIYSAPFSLASGSAIVKALAFKTGYTNSSISASAFTVSVPANRYVYNSKWQLIQTATVQTSKTSRVKTRDIVSADTLANDVASYNAATNDDQHFLETTSVPVEDAPDAECWIVNATTFYQYKHYTGVLRVNVLYNDAGWKEELALYDNAVLYLDKAPPAYVAPVIVVNPYQYYLYVVNNTTGAIVFFDDCTVYPSTTTQAGYYEERYRGFELECEKHNNYRLVSGQLYTPPTS